MFKSILVIHMYGEKIDLYRRQASARVSESEDGVELKIYFTF
jgi:hypothetical protein